MPLDRRQLCATMKRSRSGDYLTIFVDAAITGEPLAKIQLNSDATVGQLRNAAQESAQALLP